MKYYFITKIKKVAGKELLNRAIEFLGDKDECERWFNSPVLGLGNETPYEFCIKGRQKDISDLIGRLEYGVYS
ncbi:DUF2384 domain-containing protein [Candidatus Pacearchaeota archaeon]|nr:DUF2384 domain-containing protein [Candidatus Pacearchaeota archaeon]